MADEKPSTRYYALKGVNQKASKYEFPVTEALALYNLDFDIPNAWQKRPGSTYAIGSSLGTSGPISALYEFSKLNGTSFIVASSDTALFYIANNGLTLMSSGWNNGQPVDMLTFLNKMYAANGQNFAVFDGSTMVPAGLPAQTTKTFYRNGSNGNASFILVAGATANNGVLANITFTSRAIYMSYAYLRTDGYLGAADFVSNARNVVVQGQPGTSGNEYFNTNTNVMGFTVPPNRGITALAIYIAGDTCSYPGASAIIPWDPNGVGASLSPAPVAIGNLGLTLERSLTASS